jgi:hypothetical protein
MIGVNYYLGKYQQAMGAGDVAGVVQQTHWNNVKSTASIVALVDDAGLATGATVNSRGGFDYTAISQATSDERLLCGYLAPNGSDPPTVTFSGLCAAFPLGYDVIVYFDGSNDKRIQGVPDVAWVMGLEVVGVTRTMTRTVRDPANTNFSGTYVEDTGAGGNYARFHGLTDDVLTVTAWPQVDKRAAINAIQVIHVPEPATAGLVAAGLAAVLWRRRRARSV